jgi:hypothetical protein
MTHGKMFFIVVLKIEVKKMRKQILGMVFVSIVAFLFMGCPNPVDSEVKQMETVEKPVISLLSGELETVPRTASFSCATSGVTFHYTIDGTDPTASATSASSFQVTGPLTLKVIATKEGMKPSPISEATYTVRASETDSSLFSLSYSNGILTPAFSPTILDYRLTVQDSASSVDIAASGASSRSSISIDSVTPATGSASTTVAVGDGNTIVVRVVAEDGVSDTSYIFHVNVAHGNSFLESGIERTKMDEAQWTIAMSSDGKAYYAYPGKDLELYRYLYKSTNGGTSWTELGTAGTRNWYSIVTSADGSIVVASYYESSKYFLIVSRNGGISWSSPVLLNTSSSPTIAISADGRYQYYTAHLEVADGSCVPYDECLYRSTDYGATWLVAIDFSQEEQGTTADYGKLDWDRLACSTDGKTVVVGGKNTWDRGGIMRSTNYGESWTQTYLGSGKPVRALTLSGDGQRLARVGINAIYVSSDLGATWTEATTPRVNTVNYTPTELLYSNDGSVLVGIHDRVYGNVLASHLFVSSDNGKNWACPSEWPDSMISSSSALSGDGRQLLMCRGKSIQKSVDQGSSWSTLEGYGRRSWSLIGISRDGRYQLASSSLAATNSKIITNGWIYMSKDSGATWTCLDSLGQRAWSFLAVSDTGNKMVAAYCENLSYSVLVSSDGGASWSAPLALSGYATACSRDASISSDGAVIVLASYKGSTCYLSTNGGQSWVPISACANESSVIGSSVSKDGKNIVLVGYNTIWNSIDGGQTWNSKTYQAYGNKADITDDGKCIAISNSDGYVRLSKDGGSTWSKIMIPGSNASAEGANSCVGVAVSSDGRGLVIATGRSTNNTLDGCYATAPGSILISMDEGVSWTRASSAGEYAWVNLVASEDLRFVAAIARETVSGIVGCK